MVDTRIITKQELNYIETLYLQCNIQDFINLRESGHCDLYNSDIEVDDSVPYVFMMKWITDNILIHCSDPKEANGRTWYKTKNYRLGIMSYDKAIKANQFNVIIQYDWEHLYSLDPSLKGLELPFDGELRQYHIKRIDITKMFKSENDYLTNKGFISTYRTKHTIENGDKTETVYLGNRRNGNVYRMYNKTAELKTNTEKHPINDYKNELLSKYFGDIENLYTFELELHRTYLKEQLDIVTLDQLDQVYAAYHSIVGKIRIYDNTDRNKSLIVSNHRDRIEAVTITSYVEYKKVYRAKYKTSKEYVKNSIKKRIDRYLESMDIVDEVEKDKVRMDFGMSISRDECKDIYNEIGDSAVFSEKIIYFNDDGSSFDCVALDYVE